MSEHQLQRLAALLLVVIAFFALPWEALGQWLTSVQQPELAVLVGAIGNAEQAVTRLIVDATYELLVALVPAVVTAFFVRRHFLQRMRHDRELHAQDKQRGDIRLSDVQLQEMNTQLDTIERLRASAEDRRKKLADERSGAEKALAQLDADREEERQRHSALYREVRELEDAVEAKKLEKNAVPAVISNIDVDRRRIIAQINSFDDAIGEEDQTIAKHREAARRLEAQLEEDAIVRRGGNELTVQGA